MSSDLSELNPTQRFTDRASDYVQYRPSYPAAAIDCILDELGPPSDVVAADVGAGTGISARLLGDRGCRVLAIEPNTAMRHAAAPHPRVEFREGTAESTGLPDESVQLVLCAQSFHWFRSRESLTEFHRVLRPGGRLALMWNARDARDPFTAGYRQAILDVGGESAVEMQQFNPLVLDDCDWFAPHTAAEFPNEQKLTLAGLIGRAASASYVPKEGPRFDHLVELLTNLHARFADATGTAALKYVTQVFRARRLD